MKKDRCLFYKRSMTMSIISVRALFCAFNSTVTEGASVSVRDDYGGRFISSEWTQHPLDCELRSTYEPLCYPLMGLFVTNDVDKSQKALSVGILHRRSSTDNLRIYHVLVNIFCGQRLQFDTKRLTTGRWFFVIFVGSPIWRVPCLQQVTHFPLQSTPAVGLCTSRLRLSQVLAIS